jgi:uncharacterized protein YnzC (UPF0291/DUF896 family)
MYINQIDFQVKGKIESVNIPNPLGNRNTYSLILLLY